MNNDNIRLVCRILKPVLCIGLGCLMLNFSIAKFVTLSQANNFIERENIDDLFMLSVLGGAGLGLVTYSTMTVMLAIIQWLCGVISCVIELSNCAIAHVFK